MNRLLLSALAAGTIFTGGAIALAQPAPGGPPPPPGHLLFEKVDANKDGIVTRAEATAAAEARFAAIDTNRDGKISQAERQAERQAARERHRAERFAALDTDKNGQLSPQEFNTPGDKRVEGGEPGPDHGMGHRMGRGGRGFGGGFDRGLGRGGWGAGPQGDVTKADFMAPMLRHFDMLDSNDDGKITAAERDAAMARFHRGPGDRAPDDRPNI